MVGNGREDDNGRLTNNNMRNARAHRNNKASRRIKTRFHLHTIQQNRVLHRVAMAAHLKYTFFSTSHIFQITPIYILRVQRQEHNQTSRRTASELLMNVDACNR